MTVPGLVTVIVASYNHAAYLTQRMESLINQTYQHIEIIVIDDCSPDNSVKILRSYESYPKVRLVIREKNGGWVTVSNQGVDMASGEFVIFANCDDDCDPRMIERLVDAMKTNPSAGISYCRSLMVDEQNQVLGDDFEIREDAFKVRCKADTLITRSEMYRFLLEACVIPNLSAALFRKECFQKIGKLSSSYKVCCDWDLFFRVIAQYDVAYVTEPLNRFRQHKTTIRNSTKERVVYEEYFRLLLGRIVDSDFNAVERAHFRMHVMYLWAVHVIRPSLSGLNNLLYHFGCVFSYDATALFFLIPAIAYRVCELFGKIIDKSLGPGHGNKVTG